ncbi:HIRAN domain-containing protein [Maridesulfovibrio frigidus]|uniref:HIRAN domain-containing protein n=1 Tax=Maridesulfovibrio frigidus TaxID=340956 RepID=UPI000691CD8C|nr:HIRAN domain-containing protein [Maridesulfovibrio frigidus]
MKRLFIAWQNAKTRKWKTVASLMRCDKGFTFFYTLGAKSADGFIPFGRMSNLEKTYRSKELFPIFKNRLLSESRPEFKNFLNWLALEDSSYDPLDVLALTEGKRGTDSLEIFPCPQKNIDNILHVSFFSHGLRYLNEGTKLDLDMIKCGDDAFLQPDPMNRFDKLAISLRSDDPVSFLGYCPRYLKKDFHALLRRVSPEKISLKVKRINRDAPMGFRLLFDLQAPWPDDFAPCSGQDYAPLPIELATDLDCSQCNENFS